MKKYRMLTAAMSVALIASLATPAIALAVPAIPRPRGVKAQAVGMQSQGAGSVAKVARQQELLKRQIARTLAQRKRKFDAAESRLTKRIARLNSLADKAALKGANVTAAKAALTEATAKLATARLEEQKAVDLFKAVPTAPDRKAAFAAARAQAKKAQKSLQAARLQVVKAMQMLRKAIVAAKA